MSPERRRAAHRLLQMDQATIEKGYAILQKQWRSVDDEITRAEKALRNGRTPLPGERRGMVNGRSRLDAEYFARIKRLEDAVNAARKRLDKAYEARNNLRG